MKQLTPVDKKRMSDAIRNLPPGHFDEVRKRMEAEEDLLKRTIDGFNSHKRLQDRFTI